MATPVHEIRVGAVRAAIWANVSREHRTFFNVTVSRLYRDADQFRESQSFGRDELPVLSKAVELAWAWIWNQSSAAHCTERAPTTTEASRRPDGE